MCSVPKTVPPKNPRPLVHMTKVHGFILSHVSMAQGPSRWFDSGTGPDEWRLFIRLQMNGGF